MPKKPDRIALIAQALECADTIGIPNERITEAFHIVFTAFGDGWLERELRKVNPKAYSVIAGHPLARAFHTCQPSDVSEVVELATYLKMLAGERHMDKLIAALSAAEHFENTRFHLAMAYRYRRVGAEVTIDPPTKKGEADLLIGWRGERWLCECTRQNISNEEVKNENILHSLTSAAMNALGRFDAAVTVKIIVKKIFLEFDVASTLRKMRELLRQWSAKPDTDVTFEDEILTIVVRAFDDNTDPNPARTGEWPSDYTKAKSSDWNIVVESKRVPKELIDHYGREVRKGKTQQLEYPTQSRLFVRINSPSRAIEPGLIKKIRKKLSQLSGTQGYPRFILIETLGLIEKHDWNFLFREVRQLFHKHTRFVGVGFFDRRYMEDHRYHYAQYLHSNDTSGQNFPDGLFELLKESEQSNIY